MKHFTYSNLEDYLTISDAYDDVKTIKIVEELLPSLDGNIRTALIQYAVVESNKRKREDLIEDLKKHHHAPGMMREVSPLKL